MTGSLDLGTLHLKMRADKDGLRRDLAAAERDADQTGNRMGRSWWQTLLGWMRQIGALFRRGGRDAMDGFWRDANGRLHDHRGKFVAEGRKIGEALGEAASDGTRTLTSLFGQLFSMATKLTGGIGTLVLILGVLGAAFIFLIPLVYAFGGALAALPAITTGGIAAIATLLIGFQGLGEAFKKTNSAGGAVVDRARQIALAERRLGDAQREVLAAQMALNRAREEAAERIEDLGRSLRGARLDERDAVAALEQARRDLERAAEGENPEQIDAATRAYERAQLQLEETRDRLDDLNKQQDKANQGGVEGSDEVLGALERQERATREVEDATYDLGRAHRQTGGAAAQETTKLATSALAAVAAIKSLKSWYEALRLDVQERLFSGADQEILGLSAAWGPTLRTRLGSMASMFNSLFKEWAATSRDPEFISNIATGWESIEDLIGRVGKAVAGPGLRAFGVLSAAAKPFLDMLGDKLAGVIEHFAAWIEGAEKSGALQRFFDKATTFFGQIWDLGGDVLGLLGDFFSMWTDSNSGDAAVGLFDIIRNGLHDLREWLKDPEHREALKAFIDGFVLLASVSMNVIVWLVFTALPWVWNALEKTGKFFDYLGQKAVQAKDWIVTKWRELGAFFDSLPARISNAASNMWDGIKNSFRNALNWVIDAWNRLSFSLPSLTIFGQTVGGGTLSTPDIPRLAGGGLVPAAPGGRLIVAGEGGEDEIVSPESQMRRIVADELDRMRREGGAAPEVHVYIGDRELKDMVRVEIRENDRKTIRAVGAGAGTR